MLMFKDGKFQGGDYSGILEVQGNKEITQYNWWDSELKEDVHVLVIPKDHGDLKLFQGHKEGLLFLPNEDETDEYFYEDFWFSQETYVFSSLKSAIDFMEAYIGEFKEVVKSYLQKVVWNLQLKGIRDKMSSHPDYENFDDSFNSSLLKLIKEKGVNIESVKSVLKACLLEIYIYEVIKEPDFTIGLD